MQSFKKNLFSSKQPKIFLKYVPATLFVEVLDKFQAKISQKKNLVNFHKNL